jgi:hypothetical protein
MNFKEWLNQSVDIELLLPDKDNMELAVHSLQNGRPSNDNKPIEVYQGGDHYVVADGHHRLLQAIIRGEAKVPVTILKSDKPMSTKNTVALDFNDGDFYGLDSSLENGWLIRRL